MRNSSFFEKLTGSLRLSDDDLKSLSDDNSVRKVSAAHKKPSHPGTPSKAHYNEEIVEVAEGDLEIPEDADIETIEEVIEDDTIDHEEIEEYYEEILEDDEDPLSVKEIPTYHIASSRNDDEKNEVYTETQPHALPIDVFEMHHEVVLRILVSGITPENLKVSITRDRVSLSCARPAPEGIPDKNYYEREIPYGTFSRLIQLPSDVDVEHAEAVEKYGLLIIRLPKLDAKKVQELKIKSV